MINMEKPEESKDIKFGEIEIRTNTFLIIKKTEYKGQDRIDFRIWLNSPRYKGPTKQGFSLSMNKIDEFIKIIEAIKNKLGKQKLK